MKDEGWKMKNGELKLFLLFSKTAMFSSLSNLIKVNKYLYLRSLITQIRDKK